MDNARMAAAEIFGDIENGAYSNLALKNGFRKYDGLTARDKRFVSNLVYGTIDRKITLDYVISHFSKIRLKKIAPSILTILRLGIYQLMFTDKIPESAAVNESVNMAKKCGGKRAASFVNGVLRSVIREGITYPEDKLENLSVRYSYPEELIKIWSDDFGFEFTEKLLRAFSEPSSLTLRPNTLKITAEELGKRLGEYGALVKDGAVITGGFDVEENELYKKGYFSPQDIAAMHASKTLNPKAGDTVIDLCAAPGGKTAHMAELMKNKGKILAFDIYEHKIELIQKNAERLGIEIIEANTGDASVLNDSLLDTADKVLCDVPCSGWGVIGRKPEIKYRDISELETLYVIQTKILVNASKYVKSGGVIVYSTCTINRRENEDITNEFLRNNKGFEKEFEKTFYPHTDNTDGFYICRLKRSGYA